MVLGFDDVAFTTLATTAEVQLNTATSLTTPNDASGILEVIPYQMELGAFTTDESVITNFRIDSDDVNVSPCQFLLPVLDGGDGAFTAVGSPALKSYALNIPLREQSRINYFAQGQITNTVEPGVGATVVYTTGALGTQQYYQKVVNETAGGTVINTRTVGGTITITGGTRINHLMCTIGHDANAGSAVASEHGVGFVEFSSSDFRTAMPYRVAVQPYASGLGATASSLSGPGIADYKLPPGHEIPIEGRVVVDTFYTNRDTKAVADVFICGVGFLK